MLQLRLADREWLEQTRHGGLITSSDAGRCGIAGVEKLNNGIALYLAGLLAPQQNMSERMVSGQDDGAPAGRAAITEASARSLRISACQSVLQESYQKRLSSPRYVQNSTWIRSLGQGGRYLGRRERQGGGVAGHPKLASFGSEVADGPYSLDTRHPSTAILLQSFHGGMAWCTSCTVTRRSAPMHGSYVRR